MKEYTPGQVAKIFKVAPRTVSELLNEGRIRWYRVPCSQERRISEESLIKFSNDYGMDQYLIESGIIESK